MKRTNKKQADQLAKPFYKRHWGTNEARYRTRLLHHWQKFRIEKPGYWWRERRLFQKILIVLSVICMLGVSTTYGIARWYIAKHANEPLVWGVTFVPDYARHYGLDPHETMQAMVYDLGVRRFRLVSYWENGEPTPGHYNFSDLDWQFKLAEQSNSKVSLTVGLRQPRWPECHIPTWAAAQPKDFWYPKLKDYMRAVVERYKNSPVLESYQLENEYLLKVFGDCPDHTRSRLVEEYNFLKSLDSTKPIVVTRSNNAVPSWPVGQPRPDLNGAAVYKRVWDITVTKRYFEYPFPAWYYAFLAGGAELTTGRSTILHELQAEPWPPRGIDLASASIAEQDKSLNAKRLLDRFEYGRATGMRTIDLWGAEWWYWRKVRFNDPSMWDIAKQEINKDQRTGVY